MWAQTYAQTCIVADFNFLLPSAPPPRCFSTSVHVVSTPSDSDWSLHAMDPVLGQHSCYPPVPSLSPPYSFQTFELPSFEALMNDYLTMGERGEVVDDANRLVNATPRGSGESIGEDCTVDFPSQCDSIDLYLQIPKTALDQLLRMTILLLLPTRQASSTAPTPASTQARTQASSTARTQVSPTTVRQPSLTPASPISRPASSTLSLMVSRTRSVAAHLTRN